MPFFYIYWCGIVNRNIINTDREESILTVCTKGLIVVFRKESAQDFIAIAKRVRKIDPTIALLMVPDGFDPKKLPPIFYTLPTLVIYLVNPPDFEFTKVNCADGA